MLNLRQLPRFISVPREARVADVLTHDDDGGAIPPIHHGVLAFVMQAGHEMDGRPRLLQFKLGQHISQSVSEAARLKLGGR